MTESRYLKHLGKSCFKLLYWKTGYLQRMAAGLTATGLPYFSHYRTPSTVDSSWFKLFKLWKGGYLQKIAIGLNCFRVAIYSRKQLLSIVISVMKVLLSTVDSSCFKFFRYGRAVICSR